MSDDPPQLGEREFAQIRDLVHKHLGIFLPDSKVSMVESRLRPFVESSGVGSFEGLVARLLPVPSRRDLSELADRMSTNHTYFYREHSHFEHFSRQVLPALISRERARSRDLRVWSAASSSGEEPYTLAAMILEQLGAEVDRWQADVLATDISAKVLAQAKEGVYAAEDIRALPERYQRHFRAYGRGKVRASERLRAQVSFHRLNLTGDKLPSRKAFNAIFLRNVMIYFTPEQRHQLLGRLFQVLEPGGYLYIGLTESVGDFKRFRRVAPGVHQRPALAGARGLSA